MTITPKFYIVVPVFNESANLPRLFQSFSEIQSQLQLRYQIQFVLVDDGSNDDTVAIIEAFDTELDIQLLKHETNRGPGYAFGTAFEYLATYLNDDDWVLTMEGDNTSRYQLVPQMLTRSEEGYDVILASVYSYGGGITNTVTMRIILSKIANVFVKEFLGINGIMTVSSFYRLHRGSIIKALQSKYSLRIIEHDGFECMVEMLMKMIFQNCTISEVPMVLDTNLRAGKSKMKIMRTIRGYFSLFRDTKRWQR